MLTRTIMMMLYK